MTTLYVSDLDGTLLGAGGTLSAFTRDAVNGLIDKGMLFTVATGRAPFSAMYVASELRLTLPALLVNGSMEYDMARGTVDNLITFDTQDALTLAALIRAHGVEPFLYTYDAHGNQRIHARALACTRQRAFVDVRQSMGDCRFNIGPRWEEALGERIFYVVCATDYGALAAAERAVRGAGYACALYGEKYNSDFILEFGAHGANKGEAALRLKERVGADRLVVFGDNHNDIDMMEAADYAVATANAADAAKAVADEITDACGEDGVARWLLRHAT